MKVRFDEVADALYLKLDETAKVIDSEEVEPGVILDFNKDKQVIGIEILNVKMRIPLATLKHMQFEIA